VRQAYDRCEPSGECVREAAIALGTPTGLKPRAGDCGGSAFHGAPACRCQATAGDIARTQDQGGFCALVNAHA